MTGAWGADVWTLVGSGLVSGFVSALTVFVPVEAVVVAVASTQPAPVAVAVALMAALGQAAGKTVVLAAARTAGSRRWLPRRVHRRAASEAGRIDSLMSIGPTATQALTTAQPSPAAGRLFGVCAAMRRRIARVTNAGLRWLNGRWAPGVIVLSGAVGLPPLMLVAVAAGLSGIPVLRFAVACFAGRALRLLALVSVPGLASAGG